MKYLDVQRFTSCNFLLFSFIFCFGKTGNVTAQTSDKFNLYSQTSETAGLVIQYEQDLIAIRDFYSPVVQGRGGYASYSRNQPLNSPEQRKRCIEIDNNYLDQLS